jgi:magnesium transporter
VISAWRYRGGEGEPEPVTIDAGISRKPDGLLWIDCEGLTDNELERLAKELDLNEFVVEDLRNGRQRTKLDRYPEYFHVAIHDCELLGAVDEADTEIELVSREIDVVFGDGWLLSVRQTPQDSEGDPISFDILRQAFERQRGDHSSCDEGFLLWALLDIIVDRYFIVGEGVDDRLDTLQEIVLNDDIDHLRRGRPRQLFDLSKAILHFRRSALPLREVVGQVLRREVPGISEAALVHYQDLYDHVLRITDLTESQRDVLTGLRDADLAVTSNQMSLVQQRIAAWGAILIVATLITGFLGMNFKNAPHVSWLVGFLIIAGVMTLLGIPMYVYFKRKNWL